MNYELKVACWLLKYYSNCENLQEIFNKIVSDENEFFPHPFLNENEIKNELNDENSSSILILLFYFYFRGEVCLICSASKRYHYTISE